MNFKEESLHIMREVETTAHLNQRILSQKLNISLGKTNYLLKELIKKGMVKAVNFSKEPGKARKLKYVLTQKGIEDKIELTFHFLKAKEKEYKRLKEAYEEMRPQLARQKSAPNGQPDKVIGR
jgi:EPS-associated MarR family transcriptional regulator